MSQAPTTAGRPQGAAATGGPQLQRQFVSFAYYKLDPAFRRLSAEEKAAAREEFLAIFAQPTKGLSGALRRFAYAKYSEARVGHWLLLMFADRVDAWESHLASFGTLRPDNPVTQTGVRAEIGASGLSSRFGRKRTDVGHHALDPVVVAGPWVVALAGVALGARKVVRAVR